MACCCHDNEGQTFQQSVTLSAEKANNVLVTFNNLKSEIKDIKGGADWMTVIKRTYISGSPTVDLTATDNVKDGETTESRSCNLTVTDKNGDKVILSVTQEGAERRTGIEDSHDVPTEQPAYSRKQ